MASRPNVATDELPPPPAWRTASSCVSATVPTPGTCDEDPKPFSEWIDVPTFGLDPPPEALPAPEPAVPEASEPPEPFAPPPLEELPPAPVLSAPPPLLVPPPPPDPPPAIGAESLRALSNGIS
jgi:hypothetical protein